MTALTTCEWCGKPFEAKTRGSQAKKFCSLDHKNAFHKAARQWTLRAIEAGLLTPHMLRASEASYTTKSGPAVSDAEAGGA